jgi:protein subunit release factor A
MLKMLKFVRFSSSFKGELAKSLESLKYLKSPNIFEKELLSLKELSSMSEEFEDELEGELESLNLRIREEILKSKFNQKNDINGCFIELRAGAGGTEAQDLTQILARMYTRWGEQKYYVTKIVDSSSGEIAGYKSVVLQLKGEYAFGWAKFETGVHRFIRISPFDSNGKRVFHNLNYSIPLLFLYKFYQCLKRKTTILLSIQKI